MDQEDITYVSKTAVEFVRKYYKCLDKESDRPSLISFYADGIPSICEWNGHKLPTKENIQEYLSTLPPTNHVVDVVDAQPLPGNGKEGTPDHSFLVTVHGFATYDGEHKREFFHRFVIRQIETKCYIVNEYFRWLSEKI